LEVNANVVAAVVTSEDTRERRLTGIVGKVEVTKLLF